MNRRTVARRGPARNSQPLDALIGYPRHRGAALRRFVSVVTMLALMAAVAGQAVTAASADAEFGRLATAHASLEGTALSDAVTATRVARLDDEIHDRRAVRRDEGTLRRDIIGAPSPREPGNAEPPTRVPTPRPIGGMGTGTLLLRSASGEHDAPRLATKVEIEVTGMLARVTLQQTFHNPGADFVEGLYVFPLPDAAAVDTLRLRIGERVLEGEIQEKAAARRTYARARAAGQRAGVVEQQRPNLFRTAVANIGPGARIEIEIGYLQSLEYRQGEFALRVPTTITPRFLPPAAQRSATPAVCCAAEDLPPMQWHAAGVAGNFAGLSIDLDPGFPLARLESLYHEMNIVQAGERYALHPAAGRIAMDRDVEIVWQPALGSEPQAAVFGETWRGQPFALLMLMPPANAATVSGQPREVVLVIDTSGSMGGTSIVQARAALNFALGRLRPQDRFNVVRFADRASAVFREAMPADAGSVLHARRFVDSLTANGGTNIRAALGLALEPQADQRAAADGYLRQVVFVTDGSVGNERTLFADIAARLGGTRLFTVGIGSAPNHFFMRKAAQFGRGSFTHIGADHMIEQRMEGLLTRLESPAMRDIEITPPPGARIWPERIRDLYAGEPIVVRARLERPGGAFRISGWREGVAWQREIALGGSRQRAGVAALWARGQIETLMDSLVTGADADAVRARVVELALHHGLISRFTSLVAVDRTPVRAPGTPLLERRVALDAPHGSAMLGYPAGATPAAWLAIAGVLCLLLALLLRYPGRPAMGILLAPSSRGLAAGVTGRVGRRAGPAGR